MDVRVSITSGRWDNVSALKGILTQFNGPWPTLLDTHEIFPLNIRGSKEPLACKGKGRGLHGPTELQPTG